MTPAGPTAQPLLDFPVRPFALGQGMRTLTDFAKVFSLWAV